MRIFQPGHALAPVSYPPSLFFLSSPVVPDGRTPWHTLQSVRIPEPGHVLGDGFLSAFFLFPRRFARCPRQAHSLAHFAKCAHPPLPPGRWQIGGRGRRHRPRPVLLKTFQLLGQRPFKPWSVRSAAFRWLLELKYQKDVNPEEAAPLARSQPGAWAEQSRIQSPSGLQVLAL